MIPSSQFSHFRGNTSSSLMNSYSTFLFPTSLFLLVLLPRPGLSGTLPALLPFAFPLCCEPRRLSESEVPPFNVFLNLADSSSFKLLTPANRDFTVNYSRLNIVNHDSLNTYPIAHRASSTAFPRSLCLLHESTVKGKAEYNSRLFLDNDAILSESISRCRARLVWLGLHIVRGIVSLTIWCGQFWTSNHLGSVDCGMCASWCYETVDFLTKEDMVDRLHDLFDSLIRGVPRVTAVWSYLLCSLQFLSFQPSLFSSFSFLPDKMTSRAKCTLLIGRSSPAECRFSAIYSLVRDCFTSMFPEFGFLFMHMFYLN